jgi:hypothetical protein
MVASLENAYHVLPVSSSLRVFPAESLATNEIAAVVADPDGAIIPPAEVATNEATGP